MSSPFATEAGSRHPPGATWSPARTNFCVYSRQAASLELLLYADAAATVPLQVIRLDPRTNRSFFFWHVAVRELPVGTHYTWRVTLPLQAEGVADTPAAASREVLDPLCRAVSDRHWNRSANIAAPASALGLRGIVTRPPERSLPRPPPRHLENAIIYELHVGGFTRHPSAGVAQPGTWAGLIEKIPYLRDLGITHVQLLPVAAFDEQDVPASVADKGLHNYWGYGPHSLCSPHPGYCRHRDQAGQTDEFRALVQALHAAGIGVILDV
ncbi:MAG: glycogen debranching enzyme, partial [Gammaproteobacteria bacterium]|nr:glycogen debranching enzyme [Gammaproteobacteria bacterium]